MARPLATMPSRSPAQRLDPAERFHRLEQLIETGHPQHAGTADRSIVDGVATARPIVRVRGALALQRATGLDDEDRLVAAGAAAGRHEAATGADLFDVEQDRPRHRVIAEEVDDIAEADIGGLAERNEMREADVAVARPVEDGGAHGHRLRDEGDTTGQRRHVRNAGVEADMRHHQAEAIRSKHAQPVALSLAQHRSAADVDAVLPPTVASGAKDDRGAGAALAERADHRG